MSRKSVNPDMDLTTGKVPNPGSPKSKKVSGGRKAVNPPMDFAEQGTGKEANTGGAIPQSNRPQVNPNMDLTKEKPQGEVKDEIKQPVMPGVGAMPSGKDAAKKNMPD